MKLIDEKGRIFGKINIIDFLVILFLFFLVPAFYFGYKVYKKKPQIVAQKQFVTIEIDCQLIKLKPEVIDLISVGDKEFGVDGRVIGEIVWLDKITPYIFEFDLGSVKRLVKDESGLKEVSARLKLGTFIEQDVPGYKKEALVPHYKDDPLIIGRPFEFKTDKYSIIAIPKLGETKRLLLEEKFIDLYVLLEDLDEETVKLVSVGDKQLDENGRLVAEILSLGKIEDNQINFDLGEKNFVIGLDSNKKQINVKMRLRCQAGGNDEFYFNNQRIIYNIPFEFKTEKYRADAFIVFSFKDETIFGEIPLKLHVKFSNVIPEVGNIIQEGDVEKDAKGKVVSRLVSITNNAPTQVLTIKENEIITLSHPFYKDITAEIEIFALKKDDTFYFKNFPVKIGNPIVFATELYSLSGTIIALNPN